MKKVLIMGSRKQIVEILTKRSIPFSIWNNKTIKYTGSALETIIADFPKNKEELFSRAGSDAGYTHVIAGTEAAVLPASNSRVWLGARSNPKNVIERCSDKLKMKGHLSQFEIPMTSFLSAQTKLPSNEVFEQLGTPFLVKERKNSGGKGIRSAESDQDLQGVKKSEHLYEKIIQGSEGSVESFIYNKEVIFENITEYEKIKQCNIIPASFSEEIKRVISKLNREVIKALNIKWGLSHMEYYLTEEGILFGEIALRPPGGYIMNGIKLAYDFDPWEAFVDIELDERPKTKFPASCFAASYVIHPGAGKLVEVKGREECLGLPSLKKLKLKAKTGDELTTRVGTGDDMGYALFTNKDQTELLRDVLKFRETLRFSMQ